MNSIAATIVPPAKVTLGYADVLLAGVKPEAFAKMAPGLNSNSPAFIYGHLAIYPELLLGMIGKPDLARDPSDLQKLFAAGIECPKDGTDAYPAMDEIVERFRTRHNAALAAVAETDDATLLKENPIERFKERFPTIGIATNFLLNAHTMMHLGQMSAWRRAMGLGSAM